MDTAQRQAAQAYSDSATAKGWAMRTALSRLGKIARVKAVHPALEMRVNHLTSLGGPILQGLNKRPQINMLLSYFLLALSKVKFYTGKHLDTNRTVATTVHRQHVAEECQSLGHHFL
ncbi:hypothetical protein DIPPA_32271 [Diplonema papillatum]|nr:hypothetical protein DIPPA_32271 [Diplonema papillatum]